MASYKILTGAEVNTVGPRVTLHNWGA